LALAEFSTYAPTFGLQIRGSTDFRIQLTEEYFPPVPKLDKADFEN